MSAKSHIAETRKNSGQGLVPGQPVLPGSSPPADGTVKSVMVTGVLHTL